MPVERKYERDVDLLLAEEFAVNPEFAKQFKALTKFAGESAAVADFWVSKSDSLGESDLVIVYRCTDGRCIALLIEDKVDAGLQPDQAKRYRMRAERDRSNGGYSDFELVLCAPNHYIENRGYLGGFDRHISLEQIADIFDTESTPRSQYRAAFLRTAGTKRINTWVREDDTATNEFWEAAYHLASREFPILEMKRPKLTKNSSWITFRPRDFPTIPKHVYVSLKGDKGHVDLTFGNTNAYLFGSSISHLLEQNMSIHQTSASAAIRIQTSGFGVSDGIGIGLPKLKSAFEASSRLISFYRRSQTELNECAESATP